jgi:hypothetical protein
MTDKQCKGYTLLSTLGSDAKATLVDMDGKIIKEWDANGSPARMLPSGSMVGYRTTRLGKDPNKPDAPPSPKPKNGPPPGPPPGEGPPKKLSREGGDPDKMPPRPWFDNIDLVQLSWDGKEEWTFRNWDDDRTGVMMSRQHHDYELEGNPVGYYAPGQDFVKKGKMLILAHKNKVVPSVSDKEVVDDVIYEIDWDGNLTGFEWHPCDHFEEFGFDKSAKKDIYDNPSYHDDRGYGDILHLNTLSVLGPNKWYDDGDKRFHPDNIMISSRGANFIAILSRATGKIVWKAGPDFVKGTPEYKLGQFVGQHHPHIIPKGLPGEGNVLVFDNGGQSGYGGPEGYPRYTRDYSRVLEFNPVTMEIVWEYVVKEGENKFFSHFISSAQRLPNGNTLIDEGSKKHVFEVTPEKEIVWSYVYNAEGAMGLYRAYRIPPEWVPGNPGGYPEWGIIY